MSSSGPPFGANRPIESDYLVVPDAVTNANMVSDVVNIPSTPIFNRNPTEFPTYYSSSGFLIPHTTRGEVLSRNIKSIDLPQFLDVSNYKTFLCTPMMSFKSLTEYQKCVICACVECFNDQYDKKLVYQILGLTQAKMNQFWNHIRYVSYRQGRSFISVFNEVQKDFCDDLEPDNPLCSNSFKMDFVEVHKYQKFLLWASLKKTPTALIDRFTIPQKKYICWCNLSQDKFNGYTDLNISLIQFLGLDPLEFRAEDIPTLNEHQLLRRFCLMTIELFCNEDYRSYCMTQYDSGINNEKAGISTVKNFLTEYFHNSTLCSIFGQFNPNDIKNSLDPFLYPKFLFVSQLKDQTMKRLTQKIPNILQESLNLFLTMLDNPVLVSYLDDECQEFLQQHRGYSHYNQLGEQAQLRCRRFQIQFQAEMEHQRADHRQAQQGQQNQQAQQDQQYQPVQPQPQPQPAEHRGENGAEYNEDQGQSHTTNSYLGQLQSLSVPTVPIGPNGPMFVDDGEFPRPPEETLKAIINKLENLKIQEMAMFGEIMGIRTMRKNVEKRRNAVFLKEFSGIRVTGNQSRILGSIPPAESDFVPIHRPTVGPIYQPHEYHLLMITYSTYSDSRLALTTSISMNNMNVIDQLVMRSGFTPTRLAHLEIYLTFSEQLKNQLENLYNLESSLQELDRRHWEMVEDHWDTLEPYNLF